MNKYADIISLGRPKSNRPSMSIEARAAQFAPFSALTGYEDVIKEAERITTEKKILSESVKKLINERLNEIKNNKYTGSVKITYFIKDLKKSGGEYITKVINIKKIDSYNKRLIFETEEVFFDDILEIDYV